MIPNLHNVIAITNHAHTRFPITSHYFKRDTALVEDGLKGFWPYEKRVQIPMMQQLGVTGRLWRQPHPKPSFRSPYQPDRVPPMYGTGLQWLQSNGEAVLGDLDGFVAAIHKTRDAIPGFFGWYYGGHLMGDTNVGQENIWADDPVLYEAWHTPDGGAAINSFIAKLDKAATPAMLAELNYMVDASARVPADSPIMPWFNALYEWFTAKGLLFGVESPGWRPDFPHLHRFFGGAMWGVRRGGINAGYKKGPLVCFVDQKGAHQIKGDIGGWSAVYHTEIATRVLDCLIAGDHPAIYLEPIASAKNASGGPRWHSIEEWIFEWTNSEYEQPDIVIPGDMTGDGFVGVDDLNVVLNNWNRQVDPLTNGDTTGDGWVGIEDLNNVLSNWNTGTPPKRVDPVTKAIDF